MGEARGSRGEFEEAVARGIASLIALPFTVLDRVSEALGPEVLEARRHFLNSQAEILRGIQKLIEGGVSYIERSSKELEKRIAELRPKKEKVEVE